MRYKIGDKVRVNSKDGASSSLIGPTFKVTSVDYDTYRTR